MESTPLCRSVTSLTIDVRQVGLSLSAHAVRYVCSLIRETEAPVSSTICSVFPLTSTSIMIGLTCRLSSLWQMSPLFLDQRLILRYPAPATWLGEAV